MIAAESKLSGSAAEPKLLGRAALGAISLLSANLGLLLLYVVLDLTLEQLVVVYWWESFWIGLFATLKLIAASIFGDPYRNRWIVFGAGANLLVSLLAIGFVVGEFLGILFLTGGALWLALAELSGTDVEALLFRDLGLVFGSSVLFLAGHGLSFVVNFLLFGEFRSARAGDLLALPLRRCVALWGAIVVAFGAAYALPDIARSGAFVVVLVLLKIVGDYRLHRAERRAFAASADRAY